MRHRKKRNPFFQFMTAMIGCAALLVTVVLPSGTVSAEVSGNSALTATAKRRFNEFNGLLKEKRALGYNCYKAVQLGKHARETGQQGDVETAIELFEEAIHTLRVCDFPMKLDPQFPTIVGHDAAGRSGDAAGETVGVGGMRIELNERGRITGLTLDNLAEHTAPCTGGFYVLDPGSGVMDLLEGSVRNGEGGLVYQAKSDACDVRIEASYTTRAECIDIKGKLINTTGRDRGVVLCFKLPVAASDFKWWDDADLALPIPTRPAILQNSSMASYLGSSERLISIYPLACLSSAVAGLAAGVAIDLPSVFRINYDTRDRSLNIYYEFGLSGETAAFPHAAPFHIVLYPLGNPEWGFRSALDTYYRLFPQAFIDRVEEPGAWGRVDDARLLKSDYKSLGFSFLQGENTTSETGRAYGLYSLRYCRPWNYILERGGTALQSSFDSRQLLQNSVRDGNRPSSQTLLYGRAPLERVSAAAANSVVHGPDGSDLIKTDRKGRSVSYVINPDPEITEGGNRLNLGRQTIDGAIIPAMEQFLRDGQRLWGLFYDVTGSLLNCENHRRGHWATAAYPLTYAYESGKPVLFGLTSACQYLSTVGEHVHRNGGLVCINTSPYPYNLVFLTGLSDMAGTEHLPGIREMNCRRALAHQKVVGFASREPWEMLLRRGLFYGAFPSQKPPKSANSNAGQIRQSRGLLATYMPLIKIIDAAGWEPVTFARTDDGEILVERFGDPAGGEFHFTLWNRTNRKKPANLTIDRKSLGIEGRRLKTRDLLSGKELQASDGVISVPLDENGLAVVAVVPAS